MDTDIITNIIIKIVRGIWNKEPKYVAGFLCSFIFIVLFSFISYHIYTIDRNDANSIDDTTDNDKANEFWDQIKQQEDMYVEGKTDRYEWKQNDREIDIFIPIPDNVIAKDIKVTFKSNNVVSINIDSANINMIDETHLDLIPYECVWQLDKNSNDNNNNNNNSKCLWITIAKKVTTKQVDYWPGVFKSDIDYTKKAKPSLYNIDKDDPNSLKEAIKSLKSKLSKDNKKNN